jgi:four helix bundle protein
MKFKFEKLIIWQKAMEFGEVINTHSLLIPKSENDNLSSQIRLPADSIALNISEGSIVQSNPEQKKFIGYTIGSLAEVVTYLYKAFNREYISKKVFQGNYDFAYNLMNMPITYRTKIEYYGTIKE